LAKGKTHNIDHRATGESAGSTFPAEPFATRTYGAEPAGAARPEAVAARSGAGLRSKGLRFLWVSDHNSLSRSVRRLSLRACNTEGQIVIGPGTPDAVIRGAKLDGEPERPFKRTLRNQSFAEGDPPFYSTPRIWALTNPAYPRARAKRTSDLHRRTRTRNRQSCLHLPVYAWCYMIRQLKSTQRGQAGLSLGTLGCWSQIRIAVVPSW